MNNPILLYALGLLMGSLITWVILRIRVDFQSDLTHGALREGITQAAFIRATSDVIEDEETHRAIQQRANEVLEEYDVPGNPEWRYDP